MSSDGLVGLVAGLSSVRLDEYAVVGSYTRFGSEVRERLKDARVRIAEACAEPAKRRDNHLVWAAPGSGKTYFVEQVASSLPGVGYSELNLARLEEDAFRGGLAEVVCAGPTVCLVDEVDAKSDESWPYEALMPFLDVNLESGGGIVFVLAGSSGATIGEFKQRIRARPKGSDVLSRVPEANSWEIAPMDAGDRILVALRQMLNASEELGRPISGVEKLALHYVGSVPHLANARQLREFAVRAVQRGSPSDDRVRYDDLFEAGDPENKHYWLQVMPAAESLANSFVLIREGAGGQDADLGSAEGSRTNLPVQLTSFVGRERELTEVCSLLGQGESRLVTLTGPGGTGKTRLALEAAGSLLDEFADGVFVVFLAAVRDREGVITAVAQALGLREQPGQTVAETVVSFLRGRRLLLVLDNFEQLVEAAPVLSQWLAMAEGVRLVVTSRRALRLSGEQVYDVRPLSLTAPSTGQEENHPEESEAVLLFAARARAARPEFAINEQNIVAVSEICARLDGLPLALELAAARVRLLPPEAMLARLDLRLGLLTGGARDLDERQQTMAAAIAWSYELLTAEEQRLFARLGVFVDGFRLEAAEAVVGEATGESLDLLEGLSSLVENSLLTERDDRDGEPRFLMLGTIREYARARLEEAGEEAQLAEAHARYFLTLAEEAASHWEDKEHQRWIARLADDHANLDAALTTLHDTDPEAELQLAAALGDYWEGRGLWTEGRERLAAALIHQDGSAARARALLADGLLAFPQGRYEEAATRVQEAATLIQPDDRPARAETQRLRAWIAYMRDDIEEAETAATEALSLLSSETHIRSTVDLQRLLSHMTADHGDLEGARIRLQTILATARAHADEETLAAALESLADVERNLGHQDTARALLAESLELSRAVESHDLHAGTLTRLSQVELTAGNIAEARTLADEALTIQLSLGSRHTLAMSLYARGQAALADGDTSAARADGQEALRICVELGDRQGIAATIGHLAEISVLEHDLRTAVLLIGAAQAIRDEIAFPAKGSAKVAIVDTLQQAQAEFGEETVAALQAEGAAKPLDQTIEAALHHET